MFLVPELRNATQKIQRVCHDPVYHFVRRIAAVRAIVHHIKTDQGKNNSLKEIAGKPFQCAACSNKNLKKIIDSQ
jgi:hypothetical protein